MEIRPSLTYSIGCNLYEQLNSAYYLRISTRLTASTSAPCKFIVCWKTVALH